MHEKKKKIKRVKKSKKNKSTSKFRTCLVKIPLKRTPSPPAPPPKENARKQNEKEGKQSCCEWIHLTRRQRSTNIVRSNAKKQWWRSMNRISGRKRCWGKGNIWRPCHASLEIARSKKSWAVRLNIAVPTGEFRIPGW